MSAKIHEFTLTQSAEFFREWKNDFLSVSHFAEFHNWEESKAHDIIKVGRIAHNSQAEILKDLKK